jgi:hypothetical protein
MVKERDVVSVNRLSGPLHAAL